MLAGPSGCGKSSSPGCSPPRKLVHARPVQTRNVSSPCTTFASGPDGLAPLCRRSSRLPGGNKRDNTQCPALIQPPMRSRPNQTTKPGPHVELARSHRTSAASASRLPSATGLDCRPTGHGRPPPLESPRQATQIAKPPAFALLLTLAPSQTLAPSPLPPICFAPPVCVK